MSTLSASRSAIATASPTLATVLAHVLADPALTPRQRQDRASALRTIAKAFDRPPDQVSADPRELRARLKAFAPAMADLSERRWRNALSLLRSSLASAGITWIKARSREPLAPEWTAVFRPPLPKNACLALSRFARYCSERAITPAEVDDQVVAVFGRDIEAGGLIAQPHTVHQRTAVVWNQLATLIPGWCGQAVSVPDRRRSYILPWSVFPASLLADVEAYHRHLAGGDIEEERDFDPLKPSSLQGNMYRLRAYLAALVHRGRDPQTLRQLRDVVPLDVVRDGLRFFRDRHNGAPEASKSRDPRAWEGRACDILAVVTPMARHWVKVQPDHLKSLQLLSKGMKPRPAGLTQKNRARLRQFDDPSKLDAFIKLTAILVAEVAGKPPSQARALTVQTALAHELLLMAPIRLKNLAHLDLDRHVIRTGKLTQLAIPGWEVKNGVDIDAPLPAETAELLDLYVKRYRPLLTPQPSAWLFPGIGNRPKSLKGLRRQISTGVKRRCGIVVNPHLYRHVAAKLILDDTPGAYGTVRQVLAHKSVATTTSFYCGMETAAALRQYDQNILRRRDAASRKKTHGRR